MERDDLIEQIHGDAVTPTSPTFDHVTASGVENLFGPPETMHGIGEIEVTVSADKFTAIYRGMFPGT